MSCQPKINIKATADGAEILIYDRIGMSWFEDGVTAKQFRADLKAIGDVSTLNVRINSPGGSVVEGMAIYNALKEHQARKVVHIDGAAYSMASIVAMVGDEIRIADGAFVMIHNPYGVFEGDAEQLRKYADLLDKNQQHMVGIYSEKTGLAADEVNRLMAEETWLDAADAVAKGFATKVIGKAKAAAEVKLDGFKNIPQAVKDFYTEARAGTSGKEPTDMADQSKNEPVPATLAELEACCEGADAGFILEQMKAKATVTDALKAYTAKLKADVESAKADAVKAAAKKPEPEGKAKPGVEALAEKPKADDAGGDATEQVEQLVQARMQAANCQRHEAWGHVMSKRPDLRAALVASANANRS